MSTLTCHLVNRNPAAAATWYGSVLGAAEDAGAVCQHIRDVPSAEVARPGAAAPGQGQGQS